MNQDDIFSHNRVILCHYDSYSAALLFARYGGNVVTPSPLPEDACAIAPVEAGERHDAGAVLEALAARQGFDRAELRPTDEFQAWMSSPGGEPIRVHLFRFTGFEAPRAAIEPLGGVFKPISEMRGMPPAELNLMRQAFNLIIGGA